MKIGLIEPNETIGETLGDALRTEVRNFPEFQLFAFDPSYWFHLPDDVDIILVGDIPHEWLSANELTMAGFVRMLCAQRFTAKVVLWRDSYTGLDTSELSEAGVQRFCGKRDPIAKTALAIRRLI